MFRSQESESVHLLRRKGGNNQLQTKQTACRPVVLHSRDSHILPVHTTASCLQYKPLIHAYGTCFQQNTRAENTRTVLYVFNFNYGINHLDNNVFIL